MPNISRTKTWASNETLTASDLNAEFNGILTGINDNALDADNLTLSDAYAWTGLHTFNNANTVLGHTAALTTNAANQLQVLGTADADSSLLVGRFSADASGGQINFAKSRDGTIGDKGAVVDNDVLGGIYFYGCDVTGSSGDFATPGASVLARVNGTPGANDLPTELVFSTTADAANSTTERLRISQAGLVEVVGDLSVGDDVTLGSDSAVLSMGAGNDVTLTHDGTTGVTIAATPITVDSGGNLTLDAHTGIHIFKDAGTEVLRFTEGNSGDVTIKLATNGKDLVFTDNGDATNLKVLDAAAGINVPGEVQTTKIAYTDGDDAITIADGGGVTTASTLAIGSVAAAGSDVDKFLVLDGSGNVDYRTGTEVASDIGALTSATAADDIATGDAAVSLVTTSGNITIDAQANDADVIIKVDDGGSAVTAVTFDGSDEGNAIFVNDIQLKSDSAVLEFGADLDTSLTHTDGTGLTLNSTNKLTFGDAASFIQQSADGTLRIDGEAIIDLNASTRVDVSGDLKVGGEVQTASIGYTDGDNAITIADGGGVTTSGTLATTGAATLASLVCTAGATFGGGYGDTGVTISTLGVIQANGAITSGGAVTGSTLAGTVSTAAQNSITSASSLATVGTISTGAWQGDVIASAYLDSDTAHLSTTQTFTGDKTFTGTVTVGVDDTGKDVKFFGASAGAYMEWDESADQLRIMGASADATTSTGKLLLATSLDDINANDVLGKIDFQAPHEAGGTDAIAIAASIQAVAQATFSASVNSTDLLFLTGDSEAATEKFRITSQGELGIGGANYGTDGQVLTSTGAGTAPAWENPSSGGASLSGSTDNGLVTATGANAMAAESTALYDGSQLQLPAGSASAPSIAKVGDLNSGISWPAGDNVVISSGGTEVARANEQNQLCMGGDNEFPPGCSLGAYNATQGRPVMALKSNAAIDGSTTNLNNNIHSGYAHVADDGAVRMTTESITAGYYMVTGRKDGSGINSFVKTFFVMPGITSGGSIVELTSNIQGSPGTFSAVANSVVPTGTTGTDGEMRFSGHSSSGGFFFENRSGTLVRLAWFGFGVSG